MKKYTVEKCTTGLSAQLGGWRVLENTLNSTSTIAVCPSEEDAQRIANALNQVETEQ
jgi:hypothetical protein